MAGVENSREYIFSFQINWLYLLYQIKLKTINMKQNLQQISGKMTDADMIECILNNQAEAELFDSES